MTPLPAPTPRYEITTPTPEPWAKDIYAELDRYERDLPPAFVIDAMKGGA